MTILEWPSEPPTLEGPGIRLRAWTAPDTDAVFDACQDPEIQRRTTVPVPYRRNHAAGFVGTMAPGQWAARTGALFCIAAATDDRVLGSCGLVTVDPERRVAEVGYWVAPDARGVGVAKRAVGCLSAWAFGDGGMQRLEFHIDSDNLGSCAVAERAGCVREGVLGDRVLLRGNRVDVVLYALVR